MDEQAVYFEQAASKLNISPAAIEKDFWVCWVLGQLFSSELLKSKILFKGGTSLSKVFNLINRFSEDIDLILDWNEVAPEDPTLERTKTKQDRFNKKIIPLSRIYIEKTFLPEVQRVLNDICTAETELDAPDVINIKYPSSFGQSYLRPEIRLEIGALALWLPNARYEITPYVSEAFPTAFDNATCSVTAIKAERTFWEKATILHAEAFCPNDKPLPPRYSRHYYDLAMMANSSVKDIALSDLELLQSVAEFKAKFYPSSWAHYDLAVPETFKLLPSEYHKKALFDDYTKMEEMIFKEIPRFDDIMKTLQKLECDIHELKLPSR